MDYRDRIHNLKKQLALIIRSDVLPEKSFLAGGTALFFYCNHRLSLDLDFFTPNGFYPETFIYRLKAALKEVTVELLERDTVIAFIGSEKIKFSLFCYPYEQLAPLGYLQPLPDVRCPAASLEDLAAMKAIAVNQRGSAKDFVDLYHLIGQLRITCADLLRMVTKKYSLGTGYEYHLKTSLVFFDDAEKERTAILRMRSETTAEIMTPQEWQVIKTFFCTFVA